MNAASQRPELFFALIGAAGADLARVQEALASALRTVGYETLEVRISELISEAVGINTNSFPPLRREEVRIDTLMDAGDSIRNSVGRGDAVMWLALPKIKSLRQNRTGADNKPSFNTAYVIVSLKHPDEVSMLRKVYGDALFVISAYSPKTVRHNNLTRRIAQSHNSMNDGLFSERAQELIEKDEKRAGEGLGQNVRETFPLADFFVSIDEKMGKEVKRFIDLIFGTPFGTPTADEYWMFHAKAAALRSADLSRQVGAVITNGNKEFIAAGCNEVPLAGGGAYWDGMPEELDDRDFRHGRDANAVIRTDIIREVVQGLKKADYLHTDVASLSDDEITDSLLFGTQKSALTETRIRNLIEFGRIVHAEMSALSEAARRGLAVGGGILYCTTFPCHMCARHIIATGIKKVIYTEPYPKSMTGELYKNSVVIDGIGAAGENSVVFEPFCGVAPQLYFRLFSAVARKDAKGYIVQWSGIKAMPRISLDRSDYLDTETAFSAQIQKIDFDSVERQLNLDGRMG